MLSTFVKKHVPKVFLKMMTVNNNITEKMEIIIMKLIFKNYNGDSDKQLLVVSSG